MGNWASHAIEKLQAGEQVVIKPRGSSMKGKVESGDEVLLAPVPFQDCTTCHDAGLVVDDSGEDCECETCGAHGHWPLLEVGDIVLVSVRGMVYLHLILKERGHPLFHEYQIGNNRGGVNGWVNVNKIYGVAISVAGRIVKVLSNKE